MDWNLKAASWDFSGLDQNGAPNIDGFNRPSSFKADKIAGDFSIDLKLGGNSSSVHESLNKTKQDLLPSGSMKRSRASRNGANMALCLVDGCTSDLSNCREYHRRHKVCEVHSKTPEVSIRGLKQRFCQQCSRFHSLEEFDEGKRSCRKRLDGHNRRRRKPQPDPTRHPESFLSNFQGSQLLQFSGLHVYPSTTVANPPWSAFLSSQANSRHYNPYRQTHFAEKQSPFLGSSQLSRCKEGKQFPFLQGDDPSMNDESSADVSVSQHLPRTISFSEASGGGHGMFCDGVATRVSDSDCALSLLSSTQMQTQLQHSGNHLLQENSISLVQSMGQPLRGHSLGAINSVLVSDGRDANAPSLGMFQMQSGSSSGFGSPQMLPFNWE